MHTRTTHTRPIALQLESSRRLGSACSQCLLASLLAVCFSRSVGPERNEPLRSPHNQQRNTARPTVFRGPAERDPTRRRKTSGAGSRQDWLSAWRAPPPEGGPHNETNFELFLPAATGQPGREEGEGAPGSPLACWLARSLVLPTIRAT